MIRSPRAPGARRLSLWWTVAGLLIALGAVAGIIGLIWIVEAPWIGAALLLGGGLCLFGGYAVLRSTAPLAER